MRAYSHEFTTRLIRLTRIARDWRQADLAQALGVSRERVSQIETGRARPSPAVLKRLAVALDSDNIREIAVGEFQ